MGIPSPGNRASLPTPGSIRQNRGAASVTGVRDVTVRVPAKVNLHLGVGPVRRDGYHELVTVFQAVSIYDTVTARPSLGLRLANRGLGADELPTGPDNLVWKAASGLAQRAQCPPDADLLVDKRIPIAGGMAGGSADAAGTLVACNALWQTGLSRQELAQVAATLGADVPFPLLGGTALGTGIGEQLTPVLTTGTFHWVFATQDFGISAGEAYRELDRMRSVGEALVPAGDPHELLDALRAGDPHRVGAALVNDLQDAAVSLRPSLLDTLQAGADGGALGALVSGSGPTCAFLVADADGAGELAEYLTGAGVCAAARTATGPVPGAKLIP